MKMSEFGRLLELAGSIKKAHTSANRASLKAQVCGISKYRELIPPTFPTIT